MIQKSDAFVIFPGGAGTVQEMLALLILKEQRHPHMEGKPVFVFNRIDAEGRSFWNPLIDLLSTMGGRVPFTVVNDLDSLVPEIREKTRRLRPDGVVGGLYWFRRSQKADQQCAGADWRQPAMAPPSVFS